MKNIFDDELAFGTSFKKYYPTLCYIAKGYIKNSSLVEEIVCETFVKLWNNRENIIITTSLKDYLIKSVINTSIDYYRKELLHRERLVNIEDNMIVCASLADLDENPLDYLVTKEEHEKINQIVEHLPDRYKMTLKLYRFEQLSYEEISLKMGISKNTVKSNLREAMIQLKDLLKKSFISISLFI